MTERINIEKIFNLIKNNKDDFMGNDTLVNYILLEKTISLSEKIKAYVEKSIYAIKMKDNYSFYFYISKIIHLYLKNKENRDLSQENLFITAHSLYKASIYFQKNFPLLSIFYSFFAKEIIIKIPLTKFKEGKTIISSYESMYKLDIFKEEKYKFINDKSLINTLKQILEKPIDEKSEEIYLVDKYWYTNCIQFINSISTGININDLFNIEKTKNNWVNRNIYSDLYCGPINNIFLLDEKDFWFDPNETYTNVFIEKNIQYDVDYLTIPVKNYNVLKSVFGVYDIYEIKRKSSEIFLIDLKVMILSKLFKEKKKENYIRERHIQISKNITLKEFKNKIIRCLNYFFSSETEKVDFSKMNYDISIFSSNKLSKYEILTIITSYVYNPSRYQMESKNLFITTINDELTFQKFLKFYNKKNNQIFIEFNINCQNKFFDHPIKYRNCFDCCHNESCNYKLDKDQKFLKCKRLPSCPIKFCTKKCKKRDKDHALYHKFFNELLSVNFNIELLYDLSLEDFLNSNSKHGLISLIDLGNTSFMNSTLQCLSHCEILTVYFLSNLYKNEINSNKKFGSGGEISNCYYDFLYKAWIEDKSVNQSLNFRSIFVNFVKQLTFSQQDSCEMLKFMLDSLHEDLNRNKNKMYFDLKEQNENENDEIASKRFWNCHLKKDNSIIIDLFYGQFKNKIICSYCNHTFITYDNFNIIELPISKKNIIGSAYIINNKENNIRKVNLIIKEEEKTFEIFKKINKNKKYIGIICDHNKMFYKLLFDNSILYDNYLESREELKENDLRIIIYEYDKEEIENKIPFFVIPMCKNLESEENNHNNVNILFYPKCFFFNENEIVSLLYVNLRKYYFKYFNHPNEYFTDELINLYIINNNLSLSLKNKNLCDYCQKKCHFCKFKFDKNITFKDLKNTQSNERIFLMYLELPRINLFKDVKIYDNYNNDDGNFRIDENINLFMCLKELYKEEKLSRENLWFCKNCKEYRGVIKKIDIFRLPKILIFQIKRFKDYILPQQKNNSLIDFPINELKMDDYIIGNKGNNEHYIYELYAINQFLPNGKYNSICKNSNKWYNFNDEEYFQVKESTLVSSDAYLLFYKLKC